jgi:hypothetical protein
MLSCVSSVLLPALFLSAFSQPVTQQSAGKPEAPAAIPMPGRSRRCLLCDLRSPGSVRRDRWPKLASRPVAGKRYDDHPGQAGQAMLGTDRQWTDAFA